jgi:predicted DNA-binding protein (MmcQ/YjbR family)
VRALWPEGSGSPADSVAEVPRRAETCIRRLRAVCAALPEVEVRPRGEDGRHLAFVVRGKTFGYFLDDHHGDGRLALTCKAPPGEQALLVGSDPQRWFVPAYVGHRGWVGLRLDTRTVDWAEAREMLMESYCLTAPKRLAATVRG